MVAAEGQLYPSMTCMTKTPTVPFHQLECLLKSFILWAAFIVGSISAKGTGHCLASGAGGKTMHDVLQANEDAALEVGVVGLLLGFPLDLLVFEVLDDIS